MAGGEQASILDAMKDQWTSMVGMAGMFIATILIGLSIQPVYDIPEARAFGEAGASKGGFIALELMMIGIFTVAIIWLARKGIDWLIKGIVLFALWMSMFYAVQPYAALLLIILGMESFATVAATSFMVSAGSIYLLHIFPEWYVVNGVGIMVGAGVVTMIGVSFVPVLIILFMIAAAIYDHWAVNGSKHMLELADTMIDLKLPVLLVAPKSSDYSFLDEGDRVMRDDPPENSPMDWDDPVPNVAVGKDKPKGREALFMGLGDVIFPGMLVISSVSFLPETGSELTYVFGTMYTGPLAVGLGTLVGGLMGYLALMTQVARGKPQAGLPLLYGGSILGYLVSGYFALGIDQLWQDITFLCPISPDSLKVSNPALGLDSHAGHRHVP